MSENPSIVECTSRQAYRLKDLVDQGLKRGFVHPAQALVDNIPILVDEDGIWDRPDVVKAYCHVAKAKFPAITAGQYKALRVLHVICGYGQNLKLPGFFFIHFLKVRELPDASTSPCGPEIHHQWFSGKPAGFALPPGE